MGKRLYRNIEIRGVTYPDAGAAAAALGVSADAVRVAIRKGTQHRIGTGATGVEPMRVFAGGLHFENVDAAAAHFGVKRSAIYQAIADGRAQDFGKPPRHARVKSKPVAIGNLCFPSMDEACRALGFKQGFISKTINRRSRRGMQRVLAAAMLYVAQRKHVGGSGSLAGVSDPFRKGATIVPRAF